MTEPFTITVVGRPAPQGSKRIGASGQMREQSAYLPAWRAAVKRAAYAAMRQAGIGPLDRPVFVGAVAVAASFALPDDKRADGPPDIDKLLRSTFDALTQAGVWEDDARVTAIAADKEWRTPTGATIKIWKQE